MTSTMYTGDLADEFMFDAWTPLNFKRALGNRGAAGKSWLAPGWVGAEHQRRLQAYKVRLAYAKNASRLYLQSGDQKTIDDRREYGDPHLITETIMNAVIGDEQKLIVPGAEPNPQGTNDPEQSEAQALQEHMIEWADREQFDLSLIECERYVTQMGDGVYTLGWSSRKSRTRLRVFDPGFYFPVLGDMDDQDFPEKVHIAWELPTKPGDKYKYVHRITWELVEWDPYTVPWEEDPVDRMCLMSEGIFRLDQQAATVEDLTNPRWLEDEDGEPIQDKPLELDFIPVVHVPYNAAGAQHYGDAALDYVLQIVDDLQATDTDLQAASATTGSPPIAVHGQVAGTVTQTRRRGNGQGAATEEVLLTYGPGELIQTGEGGATLIDTSNSLVALTNYCNHLLERLETNARTPGSFLGRVSPSEVPSGFALALSFGPLRSMINECRRVRRHKYQLLLKFASRIELLGGNIDGLPSKLPELEFGSYLPADRGAAVTEATQLIAQQAASRETAIRILREAGFPQEDIEEELEKIAATDFAGAVQLANATGSDELAADYLGVKIPEPEPGEVQGAAVVDEDGNLITPTAPGPSQPGVPAAPGPEPGVGAGTPPTTR